jgi:hypothetical protein
MLSNVIEPHKGVPVQIREQGQDKGVSGSLLRVV